MNYIKITAVPKTAEEITGIKGCENFCGKDERGEYAYADYMNDMALENKRLTLERNNNAAYDYKDTTEHHWSWRKEWLKDVKEEVDWSKVPVDTPLLVWDRRLDSDEDPRENGLVRHFARVKENKIFCWTNGRTSLTARGAWDVSHWGFAQIINDELIRKIKRTHA